MIRRRLFVIVAFIVCALVVGGCKSGGPTTSSPTAGQAYYAHVDVSGFETTTLDIQLSADGRSVLSLSLGYTVPTEDFLNYEPYTFQAGEVPVVDGRFVWSRDAFEGDLRILTAVTGSFISPTSAAGTMRITKSDESHPDGDAEYSWAAAVD